MKVLGNEIYVHSGETFTIDYNIKNRDGSPYICGIYNNPYVLLSVSSSLYKQDDRYLENYWLNLNSKPTFELTKALNITDFGATSWNDAVLPSGYEKSGENYRYITVGSTITYYADVSVFYYTDAQGNTTYKYFSYTSNPSTSLAGQFVDYNFRIVKAFTQSSTSKWLAQNYFYSLSIIAGELMISYLRTLCTQRGVSYESSDTEKQLYDKLVESGYIFDKDFRYDRPITNYEIVLPLLVPTKLTVLSSLNGDL